jgi:predicted ABC-type ATPase
VPDLVVTGGQRGAGKATAAHKLLPEGLNIREFVDADAIARGISPLNPEGSAVLAGRLMIRRSRYRGLRSGSQQVATWCQPR